MNASVENANRTYTATGPGRVNLLGEHIDYNGGPVLPATIDREVTIEARAVPGSIVTLRAQDLNESASFDLKDLERKVDAQGNPMPDWAWYPAGVAWVLQKHGLSVPAIDASFTSNIPIGAGLSSSAAVLVSFAVLWQALGGWEMDRLTLARMCQEAEIKYVGVNVGLMDQFASANGVEGHALYFDTRSLFFQPVPLPPGTAIVIADSTIRHSLTNSAYNERRAQCEEAVKILSEYFPGIETLRDVPLDQYYPYEDKLPPVIQKRARHVVEEIARVEEAMRCLDAGDAACFGRLMFEGHASLRDLYEVTVPETDRLVEIASQLPGCLGARQTGGGFGGCTVNLVEDSQVEAFIAGLKKGYKEATGLDAQVYLCHASAGARVD